MKEISKVFEYPDILEYLNKRGLLKQYKKSIKNLLQGSIQSIDFKLRKPKSEKIWSLRINKKYRALGFFEKKEFIITEIYDHQ